MHPTLLMLTPDEDDDNEQADFDDLLSSELELRHLDASSDQDEM
jgi:hypothetical protein